MCVFVCVTERVRACVCDVCMCTRVCGLSYYYRPQTKFAKVIFLQVSVILSTGGGVCMVAPGGTWLFRGGCIHGCSSRGHAWLLLGGMHGCSRGHAWFFGGVRGFLMRYGQ